ncbi:DUF6264 family protein [Conyzicola sp.]|uniref:DUF6264 family protein n=1 Tax=Conyzicola sp. TaxID=1969404 RepID=UPI0039891586
MSDQRDRPQYGEYASVDEQVAAGGYRVEHEQPSTAVTPLAPPLAATRVPGAPPTPRRWDFVLTVGLLVFGAYSVASSVPSLLDFGATLDQMYELSGYGDYTELELARGIGIAILVSQSVLYVVTVIVTLMRLRARKLSFFVPLIGGALAAIVIFVLLLVAMVSDPALAATIGTPS